MRIVKLILLVAALLLVSSVPALTDTAPMPPLCPPAFSGPCPQ